MKSGTFLAWSSVMMIVSYTTGHDAMHDRTTRKQPSPAPGQPGKLAENTARALAPAGIVQLQRLIGNQQVQRLLKQGAVPIQQRSTPARLQRKLALGLTEGSATGDFVSSAHGYVHDAANRQKPVSSLALHLVDLVNVELEKASVPPVTGFAQPGSSDGQFQFQTWVLYVYTGNESDKIAGLAPDKISRMVNTVYHEARHAQQMFHIAQRKAATGWTVGKIKKDLSIPLEIAIKAFSSPMPDAAGNDAAGQKARENNAEIDGMYQSVYGVDRDYRQILISDIRRDARKLIASTENVTQANLSAKFNAEAPKMAEVIEDWSESKLPEIEAVQARVSAIVQKTPNDQKMLTYLDKLQKIILAANQAWEQDQTVETMAKLGQYGLDMWRTAYAAYVELPEELDAHAAGRAAEAQYKAKPAQNG